MDGRNLGCVGIDLGESTIEKPLLNVRKRKEVVEVDALVGLVAERSEAAEGNVVTNYRTGELIFVPEEVEDRGEKESEGGKGG